MSDGSFGECRGGWGLKAYGLIADGFFGISVFTRGPVRGQGLSLQATGLSDQALR